MAKFKVGDRVRFTDACSSTWWFGPHTDIKEGVITAIPGNIHWDVNVIPDTSGHEVAIYFREIEPIEPEQKLLSVGDKVRISRDSKYLPGEIARIHDVDPDEPGSTYLCCIGTDISWIDAEHVTPYVEASIVCLLEDGEPRPSVKPYVHASEESATKEAERLSLMHIGQEFGVFVLTEKRVAEAYEETVTKHRSVAA